MDGDTIFYKVTSATIVLKNAIFIVFVKLWPGLNSQANFWMLKYARFKNIGLPSEDKDFQYNLEAFFMVLDKEQLFQEIKTQLLNLKDKGIITPEQFYNAFVNARKELGLPTA